jgi:hypothetical protein
MSARTIGGTLDWSRLHFTVLSQAEQAAAIRRLSASGMSPHTIAGAFVFGEARAALSDRLLRLG